MLRSTLALTSFSVLNLADPESCPISAKRSRILREDSIPNPNCLLRLPACSLTFKIAPKIAAGPSCAKSPFASPSAPCKKVFIRPLPSFAASPAASAAFLKGPSKNLPNTGSSRTADSILSKSLVFDAASATAFASSSASLTNPAVVSLV